MQNDIELLKTLILENRKRIPNKMKIFREPKRYKGAFGGRGGGKSESIAKINLDDADNQQLFIVCVREIQNSIDDSVYRLLKDLINDLNYTNYKLYDNYILNKKTGSEFIFKGLWQEAKKQTTKSLANADRCWVEEAQAISDESLKILIPTIRKKGSEIWFSYNRKTLNDPVHLFLQNQPEDYKTIVEINYYDNPYLPDELKIEALNCKRLSELRNDDEYNHIWLGMPQNQGEKTALSIQSVKNAMNRSVENKGQEEIGVDVARFGNDRTIFAKRQGLQGQEGQVYKKQDLVTTYNELKRFINYNKQIKIKVDDTGIGGGLTDMLKADYYNVIPINFGEKAQQEDKYYNCISEMWGEFAKIIDEISLPNDLELLDELTNRFYTFDNKGRYKIESKDDYKKRMGKSPDKADAFLLCFYTIDEGMSFVNLGNRS